MGYLPLFLTIFFSASLTIIFKLFELKKIKTFNAIVVNYFVAASFAFIVSNEVPSINRLYEAQWNQASILLGILFISLFNLLAFTAQKIGVAQANIANKTSFIFPIVCGILVFQEEVLVSKIAGVVLALLAVYFTSDKKQDENLNGKGSFFWLTLLFVGCGFLDLLFFFVEQLDLVPDADTAVFPGYSFFFAGLMGGVILLIQLLTKRSSFAVKDFLGGLLLGIFNFLSIYTFMRAISIESLESSVAIMIVNMGIIVGAALMARIFYKETFTLRKSIALALAVASIALVITGK